MSSSNQFILDRINQRKSKKELVLLSLVVFGIEICYAAETAFVSPILQRIGLPVHLMTMVWSLSPIVGFFMCPILGSLSDGCNLSYGRRRPFIIFYSIGIVIGLILIGYGDVLGNIWSTSNGNNFTRGPNIYIILLTIIGVILLDFDCDACQSPARAYLIDVSQAEDHNVGLTTFTVMAGAGGSFGYVLGAIPWGKPLVTKSDAYINSSSKLYYFNNQTNETSFFEDDTDFDASISEHKQILFTFVAIIYIICLVVSITSFKEIPLYALDKIRKKSSTPYERMDNDYDDDTCDFEEDIQNKNVSTQQQQQQQQVNSASMWQTLKYYMKSIVNMPSSIKLLCVAHCLSWMSLLCYSLYFTDFVGEEIYGDSSSSSYSSFFIILFFNLFMNLC
jgi:solute carrier family 45, member 1/2/4